MDEQDERSIEDRLPDRPSAETSRPGSKMPTGFIAGPAVNVGDLGDVAEPDPSEVAGVTDEGDPDEESPPQ